MKSPNTPEDFERLVRQVDDGAMKKLANEFPSTVNDASRCLYCGQYLEEGLCKHWVATLKDDGDGFDTVNPLYFGWMEHCGENHEEMMVSLNRHCDALRALSEQVVRDGSGEAKRTVRDAKGLRLAEKAILAEAIKLVARLGASENYETAQDLLTGEFGSQMKNIFTDFPFATAANVAKLIAQFGTWPAHGAQHIIAQENNYRCSRQLLWNGPSPRGWGKRQASREN